MQTRGTRIIEPAEWLSIINKGLTKGKYEGKVSTQLQVMSLRLALTDPTKEFHMTDGALAPANHHFAWAAAYAIWSTMEGYGQVER